MYSRNIVMVFYPTGAAYGLAVRCAAAWHGPSRELGPCAKLDGLSCMHQLFPGREPHQLYFVALERGYNMRKHKKSLSMQDTPRKSSSPRTSHRSKFGCKWRRKVFQIAFKALEVALVILQIIQCFCEMFKK